MGLTNTIINGFINVGLTNTIMKTSMGLTNTIIRHQWV